MSISGEYQYYALRSKEDPAGIARHKDGTFEVFRLGEWVPKQELIAIFFGEYNDYEEITEEEANQIINNRRDRFVSKKGDIEILYIPKKKDI